VGAFVGGHEPADDLAGVARRVPEDVDEQGQRFAASESGDRP
jgi:hypothetical protein